MEAVMKVTLNKIIANDIVEYALSDSISENYIFSLDTYLSKCDYSTSMYILKNMNSITDNIYLHEKVIDLEVDKDTKELNMIFYLEDLMTDFEKKIYDKAKELNISLNYDDVKDIADKVLNSKTLNKELIDEIKKYDNDMEMM